MPKGSSTCPICGGSGKVTENSDLYDFVTRDPQTSTCLICGGSGHVGTRQKLPNGDRVLSLAEATQTKRRAQRGLDLSRRGITAPPRTELPDDMEEGAYPDPSPAQLSHAINQSTCSAQINPICTASTPPTDTWQTVIGGVDAAFSDLSIPREHPHYPSIYSMIRGYEMNAGTWTATNEEEYVAGLLYHIQNLTKQIKEKHNG